MAERSKALASGASPKGRGFESHFCHFRMSFYWAYDISPLIFRYWRSVCPSG